MKKISLLSLFAIVFSAPCFAQQVDEEVVQDSQFESRMIIASDDGSGAMPQVAIMSSDGAGFGDMVFSTDVAGTFHGGAPDVFSLAQNRSVQKEIELVDDQLEQLKEINADFSKRMKEHMKSLQDDKGNFDISRAKELSESIKKINEEKQARMRDVFLPHQFERLRQISLQTQMKRSGETNMLANKEVVEALGLTDKQIKKLKEKAKELKSEMEEKVKRMKEEAREELFDELTSDQRKKLESLLGNDFELKTPSFRDRMQRIRNRQQEEKEDR